MLVKFYFVAIKHNHDFFRQTMLTQLLLQTPKVNVFSHTVWVLKVCLSQTTTRKFTCTRPTELSSSCSLLQDSVRCRLQMDTALNKYRTLALRFGPV